LFVAGLALLAGGASFAASAKPVSVTQQALQPFVDRGEIAGAEVMIVAADGILEHDTIGYFDMAAKRPMPKDALFWLASTVKPFIGTAVMMLVEEGRVGLDEPVAKYLPSFNPPVAINPDDPANTKTRPAARPITMRMLLSHSSGMYSGSPADEPTEDARPLAERVASYGRLLQFDPATRFWYGNADLNTAAYIVERVSGMPFDRFLTRRLLEPLGMTETRFCPTEVELRRLPVAYTAPENGGPGLVPLPKNPFLSYPLSDCTHRYPVPTTFFSTAQDLSRFARMLLNGGTLDGHRYLTQASIDEMTRNQLPEPIRLTVPLSAPPDNMGYGLGWGASLDGSYFHPGTGMTDVRVDPTHKVATILLMQSTAPASFTARTALLKASDARYLHARR
jgi:CubicO group peptidase (beta-lactamase class C family)